MSNIIIDGQAYEVLDAKERMTVPDCWARNKIGSGHGEAKFYISSRNAEFLEFFDDFSRKCFFLKSDFMKYLNEVKNEYLNPEQPYRKKEKMPESWKQYYEEISLLNDEILIFNIKYQKHIKGERGYINSEDMIYRKILRKISLPNITYLSALKIKSLTGEIFYYFRLFVDYFAEDIKDNKEEIKIEKSKLSDVQKDILVKARIGQGKYREGVLAECPFCPITMVSDDRLLIASHIKPWVKSETKEKIDPKNGFMLTPTYDFLFDRGFITFTDDQKMVVSAWLSKMTCSKLNLMDGKKYPQLPVKGREYYLEYHRKHIFKE